MRLLRYFHSRQPRPVRLARALSIEERQFLWVKREIQIQIIRHVMKCHDEWASKLDVILSYYHQFLRLLLATNDTSWERHTIQVIAMSHTRPPIFRRINCWNLFLFDRCSQMQMILQLKIDRSRRSIADARFSISVRLPLLQERMTSVDLLDHLNLQRHLLRHS